MNTGGFLLIDKPEGPTTFQLLSPLRRRWRGERVGHAGTLDSGASGLVIAAIGPSSRLLSLIEAQEKEYTFRLQLGFRTTTGDLTGEIVQRQEHFSATRDDLQALLPQFRGEQMQIPPDYSALKIDGKRASDRVRAGETIELKPRPVLISKLELTDERSDAEEKSFDLHCVVSKGTYVRSLGRDLAQALGGIGTVSRIRRLRVGNALLSDAWKWEKEGEIPSLLSPERLLKVDQWVALPTELKLLRNGVRIDLSRISPLEQEANQDIPEGDGGIFVVDEKGVLQLYATLRPGVDPFASAEQSRGLLVSPRVQLFRESSE